MWNWRRTLDRIARIFFNRYTAVLFGLALLGFSVLVWTTEPGPGPGDNVYCNGQAMRPGDTCIHTDYRNSDNNRANSLEEERAEQLSKGQTNDAVFGILCPALSALSIGGGIFFMVRRRRLSRTKALPSVPG
jgi:hypothetical protein